MKRTKDEIVELANKIKEFIDKDFHMTTDYVNIVKEITGIEFKSGKWYDFYEAPASTKFHGAFKGGLVLHSLTVYYCALRLAQAFGLDYTEIDANACIFHDLVKVNLYKPLKIGTGFSYNIDMVTLPHGSESLKRMSELNIPISSEAWKMAVAYHMGAFEKDNMEMYSRGCDKYPEVLLLHTADMMATKIYKH